MSLVTMYESSVRRKRDEISRLKTDRVKYVNIVNNCSKKILTATKQANSTKSSSTFKSRMNEIDRENKTVYHHAPLSSKFLRKKFKKEKQYISAGEAINKIIGGNTVYFDYELKDKVVKGKAYYCTIQQSMVTEFFNHSMPSSANLFAVTMKILFNGTWYI